MDGSRLDSGADLQKVSRKYSLVRLWRIGGGAANSMGRKYPNRSARWKSSLNLKAESATS
jgi:hypothetical protein